MRAHAFQRRTASSLCAGLSDSARSKHASASCSQPTADADEWNESRWSAAFARRSWMMPA
jgi:hypothetical protein